METLIIERKGQTFIVRFRWGVSRGRDTFGYNTCSAFVDGRRVGSCNGGGYDMQGTALAPWLETQLRNSASFYGLTWHDPNWKPTEKCMERERAGELSELDYWVARACDYRHGKHGGMVVSGCGMDMGFAVVYALSQKLYGSGYPCLGQRKDGLSRCHSSFHQGKHWNDFASEPVHKDGYALNHKWL